MISDTRFKSLLNSDPIDIGPILPESPSLALIQGCWSCNLAATGLRDPLIHNGNLESEVALIGRNPSQDDIIYGHFFNPGCKMGWQFDEYLEVLRLTRDEVFISHIVHCSTPGDRMVFEVEREACKDFTGTTLRMLPNLKVVILMGLDAVKGVLGRSHPSPAVFLGVMYKGSIDEREILIVPALHPGMVARNFHTWEWMRALLEKVKGFING